MASAVVSLTRLTDSEVLAAIAQGRARADQEHKPLPEVLDVLRQSSFIGLAVPTEYGGKGGDARDINEFVAEVAAVDPSIAIILFQHYAVSARIADWGTPEQKQTILPKLANGTWLAASAWSEVGAGANKKNISTQATKTGQGTWVLNGRKSFTTGAGIADVYLVLVQTSELTGESSCSYGAAGQTFFLVEATNPGIQPETSFRLVGMRGSATGCIRLSDCLVPANQMLGEVGAAPRIIATVRESGATLGAVSVGIAEAAYRRATKELSQKGRLESDLIKDVLLNCLQQIESAKSLIYRASDPAAPSRGELTLLSKLVASEMAEGVCTRLTQVLGSSGFVEQAPLSIYGRDAQAVAHMGPTNPLCREILGQGQLSQFTRSASHA